MMQASQPDFCCSSNILSIATKRSGWAWPNRVGPLSLCLSLSHSYASQWHHNAMPLWSICMGPVATNSPAVGRLAHCLHADAAYLGTIISIILFLFFFLPKLPIFRSTTAWLMQSTMPWYVYIWPKRHFPGFTSSAMWFSCNSLDVCGCGHTFQIEIFAICIDFSFCVP